MVLFEFKYSFNSKVKSNFGGKNVKEQDDLDDAREIAAAWTYFRGNQVEQLFKILKRICKGR